MLSLNPRRTHKKGNKGISVLFLFIALLLIAVSVSAVLLYQSEKLAEHGKRNLERTEGQFKHMQVVEVAGYDGRDQNFNKLTIDAKLAMDSKPIDLRRLSLSIGEEDYRTMLKFRGADAPIEESIEGYNTWAPQQFGELTYTATGLSFLPPLEDDSVYPLPLDVDGDGLAADGIELCDDDGPCPGQYDGTHVYFHLSNGDEAYAELRNDDGTLANVSEGGETLDVSQSPIIGDEVYGYISLSATSSAPYEVSGSGHLDTKGYPLDTDVDEDGEIDYMGLNSTHVLFYVSGHNSMISYPLGVNLSGGGHDLDFRQRVTNDNRYGTLTIDGTTSGTVNGIDEDVDVEFKPYHNGQGYYVTEHLLRMEDSREFYMLPGDIVRFHVETYRNISVDEVFTIRFFYHDLESPPKQVNVGNTIPNKRKVPLYPDP